MSDAKWETVVNKKKSHVTKADVKRVTQKFVEGDTIPKVEENAPLKLDETAYAKAFEEREVPGVQEISDSSFEKYPSIVPFESERLIQDDKQAETKSPRTRREKKKVKPAVAVFDVEAAIQKPDRDQLGEVIENIQARFPSSHLIWLKEVASWLQPLLTSPPEKDLFFSQQASDYPLCYLSPELRATLLELLASCSDNSIGDFFASLVASMISQIQQGRGTLSERILIQLINTSNSKIIPLNCQEIVNGKSKNADDYLAVMWAFSQYTDNLTECFQIWWTSMFPCLKSKHHGQAAVAYLQRFIKIHSKSVGEVECVSAEQLLQILEARVSMQNSNILTEEFAEILPHVLLLHLKKDTAQKTFNYFLPLTTKSELGAELKIQILSVLVECLMINSLTMEFWIDNFVTNLKASSNLLRHIDENATEFSQRAKNCGEYRYRNVLGRSAYCMLQRMEKGNETGKMEKKAGFKDCRNMCLSLIRRHDKTTSGAFALVRIVKMLFVVLMALVATDVYRNSWQESTTGKFVKTHGIDERAQIVLNYTHQYTDKLTSFCGQHIPPIYAKVHSHLAPAMEVSWSYIHPALELSWHFIVEASKWAHTQLKPAIQYMNQVIPPLLEQMTELTNDWYILASTKISLAYSSAYPFVHKHVSFVIEWITLHVTFIINWFAVNVPRAYTYLCELLAVILRGVYELSPHTFERMRTMAVDVSAYIAITAPLAWERVMEVTSDGADVTRTYFIEGKAWLVRSMNSSPVAAAK